MIKDDKNSVNTKTGSKPFLPGSRSVGFCDQKFKRWKISDVHANVIIVEKWKAMINLHNENLIPLRMQSQWRRDMLVYHAKFCGMLAKVFGPVTKMVEQLNGTMDFQLMWEREKAA